MGKVIEDLKNEHQAILSSLQILDTLTGRLDRSLDVERRDIHDFIGFLKQFADKCHHGKEEGFLFPALVKAGIPDKRSSIRILMFEHVRGRELLREMEAAVSEKEDLESFSKAAKHYSSLLQAHIERENTFLFPTAERVLTAAQLDQIYDAFEQHERKVMGLSRHEELHAILKKLKQKYTA